MNEATTERPTRISPTTLILAALAAAIGGAIFAASLGRLGAAQTPQLPSQTVRYYPTGTDELQYPHLQVVDPWSELSKSFANTEQAAWGIGIRFLERHPGVDKAIVRVPGEPNEWNRDPSVEYEVYRSARGFQIQPRHIAQWHNYSDPEE